MVCIFVCFTEMQKCTVKLDYYEYVYSDFSDITIFSIPIVSLFLS